MVDGFGELEVFFIGGSSSFKEEGWILSRASSWGHGGGVGMWNSVELQWCYPKKWKLNDKEKVEGKTMEEKGRIRRKRIVGYAEGCRVHYMSLEEHGR